mmetsp:Transcript_29091/g.55976  ORF Transcript_29091/g.55976 Transcript_29091/m.55976 type:complete len:281 (+) Transcript_29091:489-1331(+)
MLRQRLHHPRHPDIPSQHAAHRLGQWRCDPNLPSESNSVCSYRPRSNWHLPQGAARSPSRPRCTAQRSSQTDGATAHSRGNVRAGSLRMSSGWAQGQTGRDGRTIDRPSSNAPLHTTDALTECQSNTPPKACGSATRDQSMDGLCGCKTQPDIGGCRPDLQTGQSNGADDLGEHDLPERTRKTAPPVLPASVPSSPNLPINKRIESAIAHPIKEEFFNRIRHKEQHRFGVENLDHDALPESALGVCPSLRIEVWVDPACADHLQPEPDQIGCADQFERDV